MHVEWSHNSWSGKYAAFAIWYDRRQGTRSCTAYSLRWMNQIQSPPLVQKTVCAKSLELDNHMLVPTEHGVGTKIRILLR